MAHGSPDWWGVAPKDTTYGLNDMAELAVRLGSIVSFDRRGDVVFLEDFSNGLSRWVETGSGTGNDVCPTCYPVKTRGLSALLHTGSAAGNVSGIVRELPYPVLSQIGVECSFVVYAGIKYVEIFYFLYTGSILYTYKAYYDHPNGRLYIRTSGGEVQIGTPGAVYEGYANFQTMKLVVNVLTGRYVRLLFNEHVYLIDQYSPQSASNSGVKRAVIQLSCEAASAGGKEVALDDVIYTINEP